MAETFEDVLNSVDNAWYSRGKDGMGRAQICEFLRRAQDVGFSKGMGYMSFSQAEVNGPPLAWAKIMTARMDAVEAAVGKPGDLALKLEMIDLVDEKATRILDLMRLLEERFKKHVAKKHAIGCQ